jgi:hypothetical protein
VKSSPACRHLTGVPGIGVRCPSSRATAARYAPKRLAPCPGTSSADFQLCVSGHGS